MADLRRAAAPVLAAAVGLSLVVASLFGGVLPQTSAPSRLDGYRVVYAVEDRSGPRPKPHTEVLEVRRPFDGRLDVFDGDDFVTGRITNREFQWQLGEDEVLDFGVRRPPGGPARDLSYAALADAAREGVVHTAGTGAAAGRRCTWFAFKDPFPDKLAPPTRDSRVEACVDPAGILLRNVWTIDDRTVFSMEATEVTTRILSPSRFLAGVDPKDVEVEQPEAAETLRTQTVVGDNVTLDDPPIALDVPRGWKALRRAGVVQASPTSGRAVRLSSIAYGSPDGLVIVDRGVHRTDEPTWPADEGTPTAVRVGNGRLVYYGEYVELRITSGEGFARILAPSRSLALAFARGMAVR